ncbi:GtrA family protein [Coxiella burnetii]|uniref:GtrA family protein n=2 Tax=Coxiella burnetii TaxID=777 RepID=Q83AN0_COXBU|nr:GtrA family protein [Coxiella burnetii]NP_820830.1 GtrA family protein [Coxiella burnetii RSA 493]AAO91344.1 GtrA family protein [Coxiella burnetii RSA 493]ABS76826.1 GtrA family protein [Coxiella burnetii Dugway 5J108-111]ABX78741.1 GtrA family protein [Coxiella burnetii RSA 331]ACJ17673.1 GtrA family protein [Coxiella burnetii CbuG_Q212]AML48249.1 sugar translocase [Coxiella burnetii]
MIKKLILFVYRYSLIRFLTIGVIGLLIDITFLYLFRHEMGLIPAKILSYVIAVTITWFLNRCFTFRSQDSRRVQEWMRYAFIYAITGCIHVLMFTALVYRYPVLHTHPIFALIITAVVIAFINFGFTKYFAFKKRSIAEPSLFNSHQAI